MKYRAILGVSVAIPLMIFMCWLCDLSASDASRMPGLRAASAIVSEIYVVKGVGVSHVLAM